MAVDMELKAGTGRKGNKRDAVYVDIKQGQVVIDDGKAYTIKPDLSLEELLWIIDSNGIPCDRLWICGELPEDFAAWLTNSRMWERFTMGKRGIALDNEKAENHVARYARRETGQEVEVRCIYTWFGNGDYTVRQARDAMALLNQYLAAAFPGEQVAYATPALTFQTLWKLKMRLQGKDFKPLPQDIRDLIRNYTGQGRIEMCTPTGVTRIPALYYYDSIFAYSKHTWGMPTELDTHDNKNVFAGKVPARYRIRFTVPEDWAHLGVFMTPKQLVTGNARDSHLWAYPGDTCQGRTFETWADGAEIDVLIRHYAPVPSHKPDASKDEIKLAKERAYNLGQSKAFDEWDIRILERIVFKSESASEQVKPLDSLSKALTDMRDKVENDARQNRERLKIYNMVRGALRNILLHGIGSFHRKNRETTYILSVDDYAPEGYSSRREIDEHTVWYTVPERIEAYTQQFEHPEWSSLIWARCRARMIESAWSLPRESVISIRTDAIAVTTNQPDWNENVKRGTLRPKWSVEKPVKAPHTFEEFDTLARKVVKGGK